MSNIDQTNMTLYSLTKNGIRTSILLISVKDVLIKQITTNKIIYKDIGTTREKAEKIMTSLSELYQNIAGITQKVEYKDTYLIETVAIDYAKLDFEAAKNIPNANFDASNSKYISLKRTIEMLEAQGAKKIQ
ncbi:MULTISPECIES: DUF1307 domain-containing protein [unclassified Granulicatella]|uniref:DUF1307 domain-containing protein n=1 Tax=unclassified Granulicatella TaxID=2630493 RepID=UPI0010730DD9|nr:MULTISPECIES: DUF1307 domain-containing protein [unclassified Granulicatella]MBF0779625.1 DUF1307 domain-containing protein [Granulicatella sp. 19428wC4_WM01]TFU96283.1 DUF1307 domain-containing protein [Granulicatella sp. WM01]